MATTCVYFLPYFMLDRTRPPLFKEIESIDFPWPEAHSLENGIPLYALNVGMHPIVEIELVFQSGSLYEVLPGAASFTTSMLLEGTKSKTAQQIAQLMDYYGATITTRSQADFCCVTLSTLSRHLTPMLVLFVEVLCEASFSSKAFKLQQAQKTQAIQIAEKKNKRVAYKHFYQTLFTEQHPYGKQLTIEDVAALRVQDLYVHYENSFFSGCMAFVSGQFTATELQSIKQSLRQLPTHQRAQKQFQLPSNAIHKKTAVSSGKRLQSAVVIGKKLLKKDETDFLPMLVVNELLGGYFGSRLMRNIREEKGYTYGIHSSMVALQEAGYFVVATEVAQAVTQPTIREIYKEIERLQQDLVQEEELKTVQNYLLGHFLTTINDPFGIMQKFQAAHLYGLDRSYYTALYHHIRNTTAVEIRDLAQKYLSLNTLVEVVVG
ncbi:MAG TPA: pitrilysin family protein [Amoebophilaceae bacterium]|nr:pitrilysin family protein [Amoebophilaceae bacterium]